MESSGDTIIRNVSETRNKLLTKACNLLVFFHMYHDAETVKGVFNYAVCLMLIGSVYCETSCIQQ